jgi:branched-chain amino acid aminotransferase
MIWYNGAFLPEDTACLPAGDLAVQRGYGVFDYFKTSGGTPVFLEAYLARFYNSAGALRLPVGLAIPELKNILSELLQRNALADSGVRLTLTGGLSPDGYSIGTPNLIITQQPLAIITPDAFERGIGLATYNYQRQLPHAKTIDYLMAIWLQDWLRQQTADDLLYVTNNEVRECPRANIFLVTNPGTVVTPGEAILKGITRSLVLTLAEHYEERAVNVTELETAAEIFITSTTKAILPVTAVNGKPVGDGKPGKVTRLLAALLAAAIEQNIQSAR